MAFQNAPYMKDVDDLIAETPIERVLLQYGQPLPQNNQGEHRMPCVFNESCADSSYGTLTVNVSDVAKRIYCHSCGVRGNLLTLLWGLEKRKPPQGGKLRGSEFREAVQLLRELTGEPPIASSEETKARPLTSRDAVKPSKPEHNVPLKDSANIRARELVTLHQQLLVDVDQMNPAAATYFRKRPWLTPEVARRWKLGYLPNSAKGLLRGRIVYAYENERADVLSYFGRDPAFEQHWLDWERKGRSEKGKPMKHRFVKGFHRGLELYGQQGSERLADGRLDESLKTVGLVVVEGPNDVIRLDCFDVAAVGLCSNKATDQQVDKIARFARQVAGGKVILMPDTDPEGEEGFKALLWKLHQLNGLTTKLGWSSQTQGGRFASRQPESLSLEEWMVLRSRLEGSTT
jgi:DNA primase